MPTIDPPYPSLTSRWHTSTYPALSPAGRATDKVVVITGASSGIGRAAAQSFAKAGARHIALIGRRQNLLEETRKLVEQEQSGVQVTTHAVSVTDLTALKKAAEEIGKWDVLVLNAGRITKPATIEAADPLEWWEVLETNVKGNLFTAHAFLPTANKAGTSRAAVIGVSAGVVSLPPQAPPNVGASAYVASKAASLKIIEYIAAERPDLVAISVHPGVIHTALMEESGMVGKTEEERQGAKAAGYVDEESLPANFFVWASTPEAAFLNGKFATANWDVEQLVARKDEITGSDVLTSVVQGWPFSSK